VTVGDPTHLVGTVIEGRYEVVSILGRGGNGVVCEVVDRTTQRAAALKMLVGDDPTLAARLEREGKALGLLAHPSIVALVDTGRLASGSPYVVTELIRGRSLRDLLDWEPIDPRRALAIAHQVLDALEHAHAARVIHRDVKPDNVMLVDAADRDVVKLLDFGIAKSLDASGSALGDAVLTRAGLEVFGSPAYIAPEAAIGERVDERADLYSLGIVLFEMLAGKLPFHHRDSTALLRMHVTHPVPPLGRTVTREVEALLKGALAKDPGSRFASAGAMRAAVEAAGRSVAAQVRPVSPLQRWSERADALATIARGRPRRVAIASALLVLLVIVWLALRG
jgi:eukaryotic-like serine/threonine-protein kinase